MGQNNHLMRWPARWPALLIRQRKIVHKYGTAEPMCPSSEFGRILDIFKQSKLRHANVLRQCVDGSLSPIFFTIVPVSKDTQTSPSLRGGGWGAMATHRLSKQGYTRDASGSPAAVSPNASSSGLALRLALAKGKNSAPPAPPPPGVVRLNRELFTY